MDNQNNSGKAADQVVSDLKKDFTIVGRQRVHAWYAWAIVGIVFGMALGIVYVANRSTQFNTSSAAMVPVVDKLAAGLQDAPRPDEPGTATGVAAKTCSCEMAGKMVYYCFDNGGKRGDSVTVYFNKRTLPTTIQCAKDKNGNISPLADSYCDVATVKEVCRAAIRAESVQAEKDAKADCEAKLGKDFSGIVGYSNIEPGEGGKSHVNFDPESGFCKK